MAAGLPRNDAFDLHRVYHSQDHLAKSLGLEIDLWPKNSTTSASFAGVKSGHGTNNAVLRALFADPANYATIVIA